jgi:hypothetical protein
MPRSPWLASLGWTKKAGVPVEERVAATFKPTWPLLPMPVTMTRPWQARIMAIARAKLSHKELARAAFSALNPSASNCRVLVAEAIASLPSSSSERSRFKPTGMIVFPPCDARRF